MSRIPAPPAGTPVRTGFRRLTLAEVDANSYLTEQVRQQCYRILVDLDRYGEVWWTGSGHHRNLAPVRDFAFRVLLAKKRIARTDDSRRFLLTPA